MDLSHDSTSATGSMAVDAGNAGPGAVDADNARSSASVVLASMGSGAVAGRKPGT